jgi:hypothetical protein
MSANAPVLIKRPVAFRVPRADPVTGGQTISATEWRLFNDEAEAIDVDYQALFVRDGTAIVAETTREILDALLSRINFDGMDPNTFTIGELRRAI